VHAPSLVVSSLILSVLVLLGFQDRLAQVPNPQLMGRHQQRFPRRRSLPGLCTLALSSSTTVSRSLTCRHRGPPSGRPISSQLRVAVPPCRSRWPSMKLRTLRSIRPSAPTRAPTGGSPARRSGSPRPRGTCDISRRCAWAAWRVFLGPGSNTVEVTSDEGGHWWVAGFAGGVSAVRASGGALRVVAFSLSARDGLPLGTFLYVSHDAGRTWRSTAKLPA
jgi:hypothetical protein